jgi:histidyl-tRNA synthetase
MIGVDSPEADAEVVTVLASLFQKVGLTPHEVLILVNNRRLTDAQLEMIGIPKERRPAVMTWIDRRDKLTVDAWETYGREVGLSDEQIAKTKTMLADQDLWKQSEELVQFFKAIEALGLAQYIRFDPSIMRGLAYYTGTVFEAWEVGGDIKRSILGGGRYDNLLSDVGGSPLSAVGFAMGDVVMGLLMEKYGLAPKELKASPALVLVTVFDKERILDSMRLAADLRREGLNVICYPESAKLQKQFKFADRMGMQVALVIGPDEAAAGKITIKNLVDGSQFTLERAGVVDAIKKILAAQ